jgi:hypothetical protein
MFDGQSFYRSNISSANAALDPNKLANDLLTKAFTGKTDEEARDSYNTSESTSIQYTSEVYTRLLEVRRV